MASGKQAMERKEISQKELRRLTDEKKIPEEALKKAKEELPKSGEVIFKDPKDFYLEYYSILAEILGMTLIERPSRKYKTYKNIRQKRGSPGRKQKIIYCGRIKDLSKCNEELTKGQCIVHEGTCTKIEKLKEIEKKKEENIRKEVQRRQRIEKDKLRKEEENRMKFQEKRKEAEKEKIRKEAQRRQIVAKKKLQNRIRDQQRKRELQRQKGVHLRKKEEYGKAKDKLERELKVLEVKREKKRKLQQKIKAKSKANREKQKKLQERRKAEFLKAKEILEKEFIRLEKAKKKRDKEVKRCGRIPKERCTPEQTKGICRLDGERCREIAIIDAERAKLDKLKPTRKKLPCSFISEEMDCKRMRGCTFDPSRAPRALCYPTPARKKPKEYSTLPPRLSDEFQKAINALYKKYKLPKPKIEDACKAEGKSSTWKFTLPQEFMYTLMNPALDTDLKGMLLWQSVGSGKTCLALATWLMSFLPADWNMIWATKTTLVNVPIMNVEDGCNPTKKRIPDAFSRKPYAKYKNTNIISYKKLANTLGGNEQTRRNKWMKMGGTENDILHKTLLIIDEAQYLYAVKDQSFDVTSIEQSIWNSYAQSGKDSVRVLLLSATPMTYSPVPLLRLLNLIIETPLNRFLDDRKPFNFPYPHYKTQNETKDEAFDRKFEELYTETKGYDDILVTTKNAEILFKKKATGLISYLRADKNPAFFAQPEMQNIIHTDISDMQMEAIRNCSDTDRWNMAAKIFKRNKIVRRNLIKTVIDLKLTQLWNYNVNWRVGNLSNHSRKNFDLQKTKQIVKNALIGAKPGHYPKGDAFPPNVRPRKDAVVWPIAPKFRDHVELRKLFTDNYDKYIHNKDIDNAAIRLYNGREGKVDKNSTPPDRNELIENKWVDKMWNQVYTDDMNEKHEISKLLKSSKVELGVFHRLLFPTIDSLPDSLSDQYAHLLEIYQEKYDPDRVREVYGSCVEKERFIDFMTKFEKIKKKYSLGQLGDIYQNSKREGELADQRKIGTCIRQRGNISDYVSTNIQLVYLKGSQKQEQKQNSNSPTPHISSENLKFDNKAFKPQFLSIDHENSILDRMAPLLKTMMENIRTIDKNDGSGLKKHVIFTDVSKYGYGAKLIGSVFAANGYSYRKFSTLPYSEAKKDNIDPRKIVIVPSQNSNSFAVLTTAELFENNIALYRSKALLKVYNARLPREGSGSGGSKIPGLRRPGLRNPGLRSSSSESGDFDNFDNTEGHWIRFMIIDSKYKEGIDLKDVSYFHILGDVMTRADETQAIGRVLRRCGQDRLKFDQGWKVKVFYYLNRLPKDEGNSIKDIVIEQDPATFKFANLVDVMAKWSSDVAIDKLLNSAVNNYKL